MQPVLGFDTDDGKAIVLLNLRTNQPFDRVQVIYAKAIIVLSPLSVNMVMQRYICITKFASIIML